MVMIRVDIHMEMIRSRRNILITITEKSLLELRYCAPTHHNQEKFVLGILDAHRPPKSICGNIFAY